MFTNLNKISSQNRYHNFQPTRKSKPSIGDEFSGYVLLYKKLKMNKLCFTI